MSRIFVVLALLLVSHGAIAAAAPSELQRFLGDVRTLSARFTQTQYDESGKLLSERAGEFQLARPGRFRWRYDKPYEQLIVCDGHEVWNYEPDLSQVSVRSASTILRDTPAALLANGHGLQDRFSVKDAGVDAGVRRYVLSPKAADGDFGEIELWVDTGGVPVRMQLHDPLGGVSDIRFSELERNTKLSDSLFGFIPPADAELVRLDGPAP